MKYVTYYSGSVENIVEEIETVICEDCDVNTTMKNLIDKYWGKEVVYYRCILWGEDRHTYDFGSHVYFVEVRTCV